jgi:hypothetical protein
MSNPRALVAAGAGTQDQISAKRRPPSSRPTPTTRQQPTLSEPVTVAEWWKARSGESIRVTVKPYKDIHVIDVRAWWTAPDGRLRPGKGLCCHIRHVTTLAAALAKAVKTAREIGLIDEGGDG